MYCSVIVSCVCIKHSFNLWYSLLPQVLRPCAEYEYNENLISVSMAYDACHLYLYSPYTRLLNNYNNRAPLRSAALTVPK